MDNKPSIYFDNAASSHPKPEGVYAAVDSCFRRGGSPGRAAHVLAVKASELVFETRLRMASFLGVKSPERLVFTPGCTQSINMVLNGAGLKAGDIVLVSSLEHNALMRPLEKLKKQLGIQIERVPHSPGRILDPLVLSGMLEKHKPRLCAFLEASNVSGEILDLPQVSGVCASYGVPLLVDAAQSAGAFQAKLDDLSVSFWCASGHKGLFGMPGLGVLYVDPSVTLDPFVYGGTGSHSEELDMPVAYPDRLEPGTMSAPAVAGLAAGLEFLENTGLEKIAAHEMALCRSFLKWLAEKSKFQVILPELSRRTPLVSFQIEGMDPAFVAELLDREFGICVRAGLHCASAAHQTLGSSSKGLVRVSFSYFNTADELKLLCDSLENIASRSLA